MSSELKNLFLRVFCNVFGRLIPRDNCSQLDLRFFCKGFLKNLKFWKFWTFSSFSDQIHGFGAILPVFRQNTKISTFSSKLFSKMRSELKNVFLRVFSNVSGKAIPWVYSREFPITKKYIGFQKIRSGTLLPGRGHFVPSTTHYSWPAHQARTSS